MTQPRRVVGVLALLGAIGGCGRPWANIGASAPDDPERITARLAAVERRRMAEFRRDRAAAHAPRGPRHEFAAPRVDDSFALADLAGAVAPEEPTGGEEGIDREAVYLRRAPLAGFGETVRRDARHMGSDLWRDTKRVYGNPVNLAILGVSYGGALALQQTGPDGTVEDHYRRHKAYNNDWADAFSAAGNPGTHFALAGLMYLVGQQAQDDKTYEVGKTLFSALIINGLSTLVGQAATWDRAPNGEWGTFPSGHTSSTFVVATVLNEAYGPLAGVPLYGLGVLVGIERLNSGEHHLSDVLFGAVMGTVIGHSVASGRDPEIFGWKVLPYADPAGGATGMALVKSFR